MAFECRSSFGEGRRNVAAGIIERFTLVLFIFKMHFSGIFLSSPLHHYVFRNCSLVVASIYSENDKRREQPVDCIIPRSIAVSVNIVACPSRSVLKPNSLFHNEQFHGHIPRPHFTAKLALPSVLGSLMGSTSGYFSSGTLITPLVYIV